MNLQTAVITVSDSASAGRRDDASGDTLQSILTDQGWEVVKREVIPDERRLIESTLRGLCARRDIRCIITTGGTGVGPRDVTPEATLDVVERTLPGMAEAMRAESLRHTPFAMTSRQVVGIYRDTLIVNLPGSVKAVKECMAVILPVIPHVMDLIDGQTEH
jgi:molybdopterin adenylyltransferase